MKKLLKEFLRFFFTMLYFFCGDLFTRFVIQSNHDKFPTYYWLGVAVFFAVEVLIKLEEKKEGNQGKSE